MGITEISKESEMSVIIVCRSDATPDSSGKVSFELRCFYKAEPYVTETVYLWFTEDSGGNGLAFRGVITDAQQTQNGYQLTLSIPPDSRIVKSLSATTLKRQGAELHHATAGLNKKLVRHRHIGIKPITDDEGSFLDEHFAGMKPRGNIDSPASISDSGAPPEKLTAFAINEPSRDHTAGVESTDDAPDYTYRDFGEAPNDDPSSLASFSKKVRKGQPKFRENLQILYDGRCAVTGCGVSAVLEAAHIYSHAESGINHTDNGLLLRSDIHDLFDGHLLKINPDTMQIQLDPSLKNSEYWPLNGATLRPRTDNNHPSHDNLMRHFWY